MPRAHHSTFHQTQPEIRGRRRVAGEEAAGRGPGVSRNIRVPFGPFCPKPDMGHLYFFTLRLFPGLVGVYCSSFPRHTTKRSSRSDQSWSKEDPQKNRNIPQESGSARQVRAAGRATGLKGGASRLVCFPGAGGARERKQRAEVSPMEEQAGAAGKKGHRGSIYFRRTTY